jgi:hypothetical protein
VLELEVELTAAQVLAECRRRGLVVGSERVLRGLGGGRHWHLHMPGSAGTLDLSEASSTVWLKAHPLRDGGWASALAREIAKR